jgi:hypothetical protein
MKIVEGQAALASEVKIMNTRLFGGEGQPGILHMLYEKQEGFTRDLQNVKEKITLDIAAFDEKKIEPMVADIAEIKNDVSVTAWKIGSISSVGGAGLGIGITMAIKKFFGV